jgi:hypothetical protein
MHPLYALIQSQSHQIRQQSHRPAQGRSSATEQTMNAGRTARPRHRVAVAWTVGALITCLTVLATLALI